MIESRQLSDTVSLRLLRVEDAAVLTNAYVRNRTYLAPWEPRRPESYFTEKWQASDLASRVKAQEAGTTYPFGVFTGNLLIGRFTLSSIVRGPFQSGGLGYWVDRDYAGQGIGSKAVQAIVDAARGELGLHRIEAGTLLHNTSSQKVLVKAGFRLIGTAPDYLQIAGRWQDHNLYQAILHN